MLRIVPFLRWYRRKSQRLSPFDLKRATGSDSQSCDELNQSQSCAFSEPIYSINNNRMNQPRPSQVFTAGGAKVDRSSSLGSTLQYSNVDRPIDQHPMKQDEDTLAVALLAAVQDSEDEENGSSSNEDEEYEDDEADEHEIHSEEEEEEDADENHALLTGNKYTQDGTTFTNTAATAEAFHSAVLQHKERTIDDLYSMNEDKKPLPHIVWLCICFFGIMLSFVGYGLLLEYSTSDGRQLHEMSFLFITSLLYTITAASMRYVRDETASTIPPARFALLGLTSMGSTWCSVRSLRFVIFPIQVLAKSCKPVPVMIMGAILGKKYSWRKYLNVFVIVAGVALFMSGGDASNTPKKEEEKTTHSSSQMIGIILLFISLCFDGGTGAYEDKLMAVHAVGPFDLMYNIQLGKTILAGVGLIVFNQIHLFVQMCQQMGLVLVALGLTGALGQVFIFVTIAKFGALTCSIIGLARKITTLLASIFVYGHKLSLIQMIGLVLSIGSMLMEFSGKKKGDSADSSHHDPKLNNRKNDTVRDDAEPVPESLKSLHPPESSYPNTNHSIIDLEMSPLTKRTFSTATTSSNGSPPNNKLTVMTAGVC